MYRPIESTIQSEFISRDFFHRRADKSGRMANGSGGKIDDFDKRFDSPRGAIRLPRYTKRIVYCTCAAWMPIAETHSASRRARMFLNLPGVCVGDLSPWPVPLERACLCTCVNCATRNAEGGEEG